MKISIEIIEGRLEYNFDYTDFNLIDCSLLVSYLEILKEDLLDMVRDAHDNDNDKVEFEAREIKRDDNDEN